MRLNRVVITGMGAVTSFGNGVELLMQGIRKGQSTVRYMEGWEQYIGLRSQVAAPVKLQDEKKIPRQKRRSMSSMSIFAVQAAQQALSDAGISPDEIPADRIGCIIGSTMGSGQTLNEVFETIVPDKDITRISATMFFKCVSHTAAMNVAQSLGLGGYVMATAAACASSLQALGTGYNLISLGRQDVLLCGGAE